MSGLARNHCSFLIMADSCSAKIQAVQWDRLGSLLMERGRIEARILQSLMAIEDKYKNLSTELNVLLEARIHELVELAGNESVQKSFSPNVLKTY